VKSFALVEYYTTAAFNKDKENKNRSLNKSSFYYNNRQKPDGPTNWLIIIACFNFHLFIF
jgi:hypothetical protein